MSFAHPYPGQLFIYEKSPHLWRRRSGAGQVLGLHASANIVFVRLFSFAPSDALQTIIGFLPLQIDAYEASKPQVVKRVDVPADWEESWKAWEYKWRQGEAGVFSRPLDEVTQDTLDTVNHFRDLPNNHDVVIDLAYPKRSQSGRFDSIAAVVRHRHRQ